MGNNKRKSFKIKMVNSKLIIDMKIIRDKDWEISQNRVSHILYTLRNAIRRISFFTEFTFCLKKKDFTGLVSIILQNKTREDIDNINIVLLGNLSLLVKHFQLEKYRVLQQEEY